MKAKIGDCLEYVVDNRGKTPPYSITPLNHEIIETSSLATGSKYPDYSKVKKWVSDETYNTWFRRGHPVIDDVLIATVGSIGFFSVMKENRGCVAQNLVALRCDRSKLNPHYFYYLLSSHDVRQTLINMDIGVAQPSIKVPHILNLQISIPNVETQKYVANILSKYDDLLENNNKRIKILEEMAQTFYYEWFVNFRFPGHEKVKMVDSELGKIPEGWGVDTLRNNIEHYIGGGWGQDIQDAVSSAETYVIRGTDIPYLLSGDITHTVRRFEKESRYLSRKMQEGDVVFEVSGGSKDQPLGRTVVLSKNMIGRFVNVIPASFCKLIRFKIYPFYFYQLLVNFYKTRYVTKFQVQSTGLSNYNFEAFIDSKVIIPDGVVSQEFNDIISTIVNYIHTLGEENQTLKETRDLLIQKLISGEIDVSEMDI